jgi:hypothetical protein
MTDLEQLALKCETASGADRELDADIFQAIGGKQWDRAYHDAQAPCGCPHEMAVDGARRRAPRFTASLDAAMTLVPEGWVWLVSNRAPKPLAGRAYLHNGELIYSGIGGSRPNPAHKFAEVVAATPALALTAACLRARAALAKEPTR